MTITFSFPFYKGGVQANVVPATMSASKFLFMIIFRKGLFGYQVFLYRAFILEQSSLDEMKGI